MYRRHTTTRQQEIEDEVEKRKSEPTRDLLYTVKTGKEREAIGLKRHLRFYVVLYMHVQSRSSYINGKYFRPIAQTRLYQQRIVDMYAGAVHVYCI